VAFVGRARALSRLLHAVEEAAGGRARLVLVAGEAGIGKTTLVSEAAARSGWAVGWGTCADAERAPAFWAWSTALRGLLDATGPVVTEDGAELARLLPELSGQAAGEASVGPPEPGTSAADPVAPPGPGTVPVAADPVDTEAARLRLFDAVARFLERLACRAPAFVVLDDLQWADASTLDLLRFVVRPYRPVPLVIVGAYRHDELGAGAARTLAELAAHGELVQLHGLSQQEVFELIVDAVGVLAADRWAVEVHRRTEGHPFFARQLIEVLADPAQPPGTVPAAAHDLVARGWNGSRRTAGHSSRPPRWPATNCCPTCSARCAASSLRPWRCSSRRA
jgi:predicted ATPase